LAAPRNWFDHTTEAGFDPHTHDQQLGGSVVLEHFHDRVRAASDREDGMTLVEVIVAMFVFSILSIGFIYGMLTILSITRDSRATQVATNLASQEIDLARATDNLFAYGVGAGAARPDQTINGDTFHTKITAAWVSDPGIALQCGNTAGGAAGAPLRYKRVDVMVTWDGMRSLSSAVHSYTIINPKDRINDPTLGTILVSVTTDAGVGVAGVTVTATPATPANGAVALTTTPAATDAQGCSYILKVTPGNYVVSISKTNYLSSGSATEDQKATPSVNPVVVTAGKSTSQNFIYDNASYFSLAYASNSTASGVRIPTNMDTSFLHVRGLSVSPATSNALTRTVSRFPFASGAYNIMAGTYVAPTPGDGVIPPSAGCVAVDPSAWPIVVEGGVTYGPPASTVPGSVPGVFTLTGAKNMFIKAVSVNGSPACANVMTYRFGQLPNTPAGDAATLALPFGSWMLYTGSDAVNQTNLVEGPRMSPITKGTSDPSTKTLRLDARVPVTP
jgi:prepilin-type N-terminal cleavage/methylation domain-containing protein